MNNSDHIRAHHHSSRHRAELLAGDRCGCFYCLAVFRPDEICQWIDRDQTALCPHCGIDSVLGSASGYPLTHEFLTRMKEHWF